MADWSIDKGGAPLQALWRGHNRHLSPWSIGRWLLALLGCLYRSPKIAVARWSLGAALENVILSLRTPIFSFFLPFFISTPCSSHLFVHFVGSFFILCPFPLLFCSVLKRSCATCSHNCVSPPLRTFYHVASFEAVLIYFEVFGCVLAVFCTAILWQQNLYGNCLYTDGIGRKLSHSWGSTQHMETEKNTLTQ